MQEAGQYLADKQRESIEKEDSVPELQNLDRLYLNFKTNFRERSRKKNYELAAHCATRLTVFNGN
jgi:hypothetical protein